MFLKVENKPDCLYQGARAVIAQQVYFGCHKTCKQGKYVIILCGFLWLVVHQPGLRLLDLQIMSLALGYKHIKTHWVSFPDLLNCHGNVCFQ